MESNPITSWQVDGETMETVTDFIFLSSKIIVVGDCSHEIQRCLPRGKKTIINLDSILKSRGIIFPTKVRLIKAMVFPVIMYGCQTVVLEKTLESPLNCKESKSVNAKGNQPWIFIERTDAKAEAPILWPPDYLGVDSLEKTLMLGKIEGRRRGQQRMRSPNQWT